MFILIAVCILLILILFLINKIDEKRQSAKPKTPTPINPPVQSNQTAFAVQTAFQTYYPELSILLAKAMQNCAQTTNIVAPRYQAPRLCTATDVDVCQTLDELYDQIGVVPNTTPNKNGHFDFHFRGKKRYTCSLSAPALGSILEKEMNRLAQRRNYPTVSVRVFFHPADETEYSVVVSFKRNLENIVRLQQCGI